MTSYEARAVELGLDIPDLTQVAYHGFAYGSMKPFHRVGRVLYLSGHVEEDPAAPGRPIHPGLLGADVTIDQGYEAARRTAINCLATIRLALGSLDNVKAVVGSTNFVAVAPGFTDVHLVSSGATDLFRDLFGPDAGVGGRATIGVATLANNHCFENVLTMETAVTA